MKIIIDGYNVIGAEGGLGGDIDAKRARLVNSLKLYRQQKGFEIVVVFDAYQGDSRCETGDITGGVKVVFSKIGQTADQLIMRMAKEDGNRCVVISSDRMVMDSAYSSGAVGIRSDEFLRKLAASQVDESDYLYDYDEDESYNPSPPGGKRKGNAYKLSKQERAKRRILSRL